MEEIIGNNLTNILITKNANNIKITSNFECRNPNEVLRLIDNNKLFKCIYKTNKDLIEEFHQQNNKIIYIFKDELDINGGNLDYLALKVNIKKSVENITIECNKTKKFIENNYNKMEIEYLNINFNISGNKISVETKFAYVKDKIPRFLGNKLAKFIAKIMSNLFQYLEKM